MVLNIGSLAILALAAGYMLYYVNGRKAVIPAALGRAALIAAALLVSAAASVVAVQAFDYRLPAVIVYAVLFAAAAGGAGFRLYGSLPALHAALAGMLGAIAGVRFGMMLFASAIVVLAAAIAGIVAVFALQKAVDWRAKAAIQPPKAKGKRTSKAPQAFAAVLAAAVFVSGIELIVHRDRIAFGQIGQQASQQAALDEDNNLQIATIDVKATGFSPRDSRFTTGAMVKAVFRVDRPSDAGLTLVCPALGIEAPLKQGDNIFLLNRPQPGVYAFSLGGSRLTGTITIREDGEPAQREGA
ncbi:hypothetical protein [Cohnella sp. REN36]|uniref:hypothetical protein n=1 Tax=Cohnella sp. REN36 TaxID=2887347 RepID=UPI001D139A01|nr:hypothetical protein [Cohnella sp. REN36]MCC3375437.1 hypothetical protein [Cohnella sp. REN36]